MGIPDGGGACCWDGYDPSIIQKFQEAGAGALVYRGKLQTGLAPLQPPMFCHVGMQHGFLEFRVRKIVQVMGSQSSR